MKHKELHHIISYRIILIAWLYIMMSLAIPIKANQKLDSLIQIITNESERPGVLLALKDISLMYRDEPEEVDYLTQLLHKAEQQDSIHFVYDALSNLSRHYYNRSNMDSLIFWANKVDSLVSVRGDNPDSYYDIHSFISKYYLDFGYNELSIYEAIKMQDKAKESASLYGQICGAETLGVIYSMSKRDSLAIPAFQEALDLLEKIKGDLYYRVYIQSNQTQASLSLKDRSETEKYLKRYEAYISEWEGEKRQIKQKSTLNIHRWMLYLYYVDYYLKSEHIDNAKKYLDKSIDYGQQLNITDREEMAVIYYYFEQASYYQIIKKYPQAIAALDSILNYSFEPEFAHKKIELLTITGQYEEATVLYKKLLETTEQRNNSTSTKQVNQLRSLHDVNDKELQSLELKISNTKVRQNQHLFLFSLAILLILVVLAYILFVLLNRFRRLKDDLVNEKQSLLESQEDIRQAMKKAENASQMKSTFIANVSHEIRTPLNAIVGFSSLVVDSGSDEEERKEYASIINNNSDLLLNIINDILNLSKMETGNMEFKIKPCELHSSCKEILASAEHRLLPGVRLVLSFPRETFTLSTDPLRLRQLLLNLLINAAKFTKQGQIELSVNINDEKQQVRFAVTDTGCGIPLDLQDKIFERFEKVHEYVQGTGLGLAICKMISEHLGGSIFVDPGYTGGARFVFIHPFEPPCQNEI